MKAMILAAGKGLRMRPLTDHIPKPLLKVNGLPLIAYHLKALAVLGFKEVVINVSHLSHLIQAELGTGKKFGLRINYSFEEEPLGTGGGIYQALPLLGSKPFLVINGDVWTDFPLQKLPQQLGQNLAHLVLVDNPAHNPRGDYSLEKSKASIIGNQRLTFSGISVLSPKLFKKVALPVSPLQDLLRAAIEIGLVSGEYYAGKWLDIGTPEQFDLLNRM